MYVLLSSWNSSCFCPLRTRFDIRVNMTSFGTICRSSAFEAHPPPELEGKYFHDRACNFVVLLVRV